MNLSTGQYWDVSWSPVRGCSHASEGCRNCWAERMAARFCREGRYASGAMSKPREPFHGFAYVSASGPRWTGRVELIESELLKPLHWKKPRVVALNWMGDLFHEKVPDEAIDRGFGVMAWTNRHHYLILTKRSRRMREYSQAMEDLSRQQRGIRVARSNGFNVPDDTPGGMTWPLLNVALGVSVEDRAHLDRIDELRKTPAAMRFLSLEPLLESLGPLDLRGLDWVIVGGESGPGARPMHPDWARGVRDQCVSAGISFLFKQWGEWAPSTLASFWHYPLDGGPQFTNRASGRNEHDFGDGYGAVRIGKKAAGRLLDGRTWDELPEWFSDAARGRG